MTQNKPDDFSDEQNVSRDSEEQYPLEGAAPEDQDSILDEAALDPAFYESFSEGLEGDAPSDEDKSSASGPSQERQIIAALQDELDKTKDQMVRAIAEAENARKRAIKERQDASKYAVSSFAKDLLDVADNLRRALDSVPEDVADTAPQIKGLIDGVEATERSLHRSFEKNGIKKILPMDQVFDPNFHEVMFEAIIPGKAPGTIFEIIEAGYTLNERLLRPARVGVAKAAEEEEKPHPPPGSAGHMIDTKA